MRLEYNFLIKPFFLGHPCIQWTICRYNLYDGSEEFWIVVKETGKRQESQSYEEIQKKRSKAGFSI